VWIFNKEKAMKLVSHLGARLAAAGLAGALAFAAPASATTFAVTYVAVPYSEAVTLTGGTIPTNPENVGIAGQIVLTTSIGTLYTWCVDLFHTISLGPQAYTFTTGPLLTDNSGSSSSLSTEQITEIEKLATYGTSILLGTTLTTDAAKNHFNAVIQSAIWEVEYGTTASQQGDATFGTEVSNMITFVQQYSLIAGSQIYAVDSNGQRLFAVQGLYDAQLPPPPGSGIEGSVPEPTTLALLGLGLAGLGFSKRKKA
jgi:hypothetical protein